MVAIAAEGAAPIIEATELTGVQANKVIGDAAADELAESLRQAGLTVEREVPYQTPIGPRIADLRVSGPDGGVRGLTDSNHDREQREPQNAHQGNGKSTRVVAMPERAVAARAVS